MNPAKAGLSTGSKSAVVLVLIVIVLAAAYLAPSKQGLTTTNSTSSQPSGPASSSGANTQALALLPLFGNFSQMQLQESAVDNSQGGGPIPQVVTVSYLVLGKATLSSTTRVSSTTRTDTTQYLKVEFSQAGVSSNVIAWINPKGGVDRVDILGVRNYTGSGAYTLPAVTTYLSAFGLISALAGNATLISMLSKTSENMTTIGPSQLDVVTYHLVVPTQPYKSVTAKFATIPGTSTRFLVYFDEKMTDGSETTLQILSITK